MRQIARLGAILAVVAVAAGCRNHSTSLVGKWTMTTEGSQGTVTDTMEFGSDGTVVATTHLVYNGQTGDMTNAGKWEVAGSGDASILTCNFDTISVDGRTRTVEQVREDQTAQNPDLAAAGFRGDPGRLTWIIHIPRAGAVVAPRESLFDGLEAATVGMPSPDCAWWCPVLVVW